jgi:hypothetical protein
MAKRDIKRWRLFYITTDYWKDERAHDNLCAASKTTAFHTLFSLGTIEYYTHSTPTSDRDTRPFVASTNRRLTRFMFLVSRSCIHHTYIQKRNSVVDVRLMCAGVITHTNGALVVRHVRDNDPLSVSQTELKVQHTWVSVRWSNLKRGMLGSFFTNGVNDSFS